MLESLFWFLSDFLLFTPDNYLSLVRRYNQETWPLPLIGLLLGAVNLLLIKHPAPLSDRLLNLSLALSWLWVGLVFHGQYFSTINWAAPAFALLFVLQAALLLIFGVITDNIRYRDWHTPFGYTGLAIYLFALLLYPALSSYWPPNWQSAGYYGTAAETTCLATMGVLLMSDRGGYYLILPLSYCLLAAAMAWVMQLPGAGILILMAVLVLAGKLGKNRTG